MEDLSKALKLLETHIDYKFTNEFYSSNAITHPSYKKSKFELLEFTGDRVLGLSIAKTIWHEKHRSERECAEQLATKVNRFALLEIAKLWEINKYILWHGPKEHIDSILVDACEAIIGAVFLDGGWDAAHKLIQDSWPKKSMSFTELDPKSILQKWAHKISIEYKYTLINQSGPAHNPEYTIELTVNQHKITGISNSIRSAEKSAALKFLKKHTDLVK